MLQLWRSVIRLQKAQRILQARSRQAKKQCIHDLLWEASQSPSGLTSVFRLLKVLVPAAPRRKLQLRHLDGRPLGTSEAMAAIKDFFHDLYNLPTQPGCTPSLEPPDTPVQLTQSKLQHALGSIPASKALPVEEAPSLLWRAGAAVFAGKLLWNVNGWLADMRQPPSEWHIADICLIPKPSKPMLGPDSLRPISLLHPVAKALATVLNQRLLPHLHQAVADQPQYAYTAGRSAQDALDRALRHCVHVREIMQAQKQTLHLKRQDYHVEDINGGITLSLDLQKAFDLLPRHRLKEALEATTAEPGLIWTILKIQGGV